MEYLWYSALAILFIISILLKSKKNKVTDNLLDQLRSQYTSRFKIVGRVEFSSIHILLDADLEIFYSENDLIICGYDNYRTRRSKFLFHNKEELLTESSNNIKNYFIKKIDLTQYNKIIIRSENDSEIILVYKIYGKEKIQLKEIKFVELINKLNNAASQNLD